MMRSRPASASATPGKIVRALSNLNCGTCAAPDLSEQDEQESDFREAHARVMRKGEEVHAWRHSSCVAAPVSGQGVAAATPELPRSVRTLRVAVSDLAPQFSTDVSIVICAVTK